MLLRSNPADDEDDTTIDLLFKPAEAVKIRDGYAGLVVRCATTSEADAITVSMSGMRADLGYRARTPVGSGRDPARGRTMGSTIPHQY
ncbi:hypothetical protein [Dactylosporangium sp. CA-139066]|uniref:hypothetical protein n=1 Tax=Dactylosporangium sp. CA-139066 TaxID=3239930 RepID=UPI003D92B88B